MKKSIFITGLSLLMAFSPITGTIAMASTNQSDQWTLVENVWKVKDNKGGYLTGCWFQDLDQSWYILDETGAIYSGLVFDKSSDAYYYLNINHDGHFGQMQTKDGTYSVNGSNVYLSFEQSHQGKFGAIKSGLETLRNLGLKETSIGQAAPTTTTDIDKKAVEDAIKNAQAPTQSQSQPGSSSQAQGSSSSTNTNSTTQNNESQANNTQDDIDFINQCYVGSGSAGNMSQESKDMLNEAISNTYGN